MVIEEKVVIVTGAAKGIGLGCARKLAEDGATVFVVDIDFKIAKRVERNIREEGGEAFAIESDVSNSNDVKEMVENVVQTTGGIDILVNSAGIQRYGSVVDTSEDLWDEVLNINLKSMFLTSKYAIPYMQQGGSGSIVNISSIQAFATQKNVVAYTVSKGGINALTRALAVDHAKDNIRVNAVCPASVDTPMLRWAADLFKEDQTEDGVITTWGKSHPLGRVGKIEEIAEYVSFLAGPKASFITGTCNSVDGGILA